MCSGDKMYEYKNKDQKFHRDKMYFISKIFPKESGQVLDIGCHSGELGILLENKGHIYSGVDIDNKLLEEAKNKDLNVDYCDLDYTDIPFKIKFDYVTILDVLEHLHDPEKILRKIKQNLNENAKILISLPNDFHLLNRIRFLLGFPIYPDPFWAHTHLHTFTKRQAREFLNKNNLEIIKRYEIPGTFPSFLSFRTKRSLANILPTFFSRSTLYITKEK